MNKAKKAAHIGLGVVVFGLLVFLIAPSLYWISMVLWLIALGAGIAALVFNRRVFPNTEQMMGHDKSGLDVLGYVEVYVTFVPAIAAIAMIIFILSQSGS
ncbi:MAG TPA: hypothetical protein ENN07_01640 [candidate division Zixibacteria bacterium]|nr:hypothetical protein [candidate division Zixibacteria bacterium]